MAKISLNPGFWFFIIAVFFSVEAGAGSTSLPVQGYVVSNTRKLPLEGVYSVTFNFYDGCSATETLDSVSKNVTFESGIFNASLDVDSSLVEATTQLCLGIQIKDDDELARYEYQATPYAYLAGRATTADTADSATVAESLSSDAVSAVVGSGLTVSNGDIVLDTTAAQTWTAAHTWTGTQNYSAQIVSTKAPADSTSANAALRINPGSSSTNGKLIALQDNNTDRFTVDKEGDVVIAGDLSVAGALTVAGASVSGSSSSGGSSSFGSAIESSEITDATIATADIADSAITTGKITDGTIATADLADSSVTTAKIVDATIAAGDVAADGLDFASLEDTLDLDAAMTLNQGTNIWTQNFTGTTTTGFTLNANSLTSGTAMKIASTSTTGMGFNQYSVMLYLARSGANASASHEAYGIFSEVTNTGSTSKNVAGYFSASGATNNYGLIVENGTVGIGTTSPGTLLTVNGPIATAITSVSTSTTLGAAHSVVVVRTSGTAVTITLPAVASTNAGRVYTIKHIQGGDNVTLATTGSDNIDGSATYNLNTTNKYVTVVSEGQGTDWWVIANN